MANPVALSNGDGNEASPKSSANDQECSSLMAKLVASQRPERNMVYEIQSATKTHRWQAPWPSPKATVIRLPEIISERSEV